LSLEGRQMLKAVCRIILAWQITRPLWSLYLVSWGSRVMYDPWYHKWCFL